MFYKEEEEEEDKHTNRRMDVVDIRHVVRHMYKRTSKYFFLKNLLVVLGWTFSYPLQHFSRVGHKYEMSSFVIAVFWILIKGSSGSGSGSRVLKKDLKLQITTK